MQQLQIVVPPPLPPMNPARRLMAPVMPVTTIDGMSNMI
jgi:hypothetical protein